MTVSSKLLMAILSRDAYNREYRNRLFLLMLFGFAIGDICCRPSWYTWFR